ncbi:hypothetical protein FAZ69_11990 [Trinickia terrae]|uniref:Surface-adhesin protein E-like domain-containing protein n=1 Tax=Trinickia terrae TaxID=2571161 RepID=A0A4U1I861_9BURK|nr:surface-adhesin E family protein [Trinickia terrae]TKC89633.1 hypothetical protein FAZ69_11990 [Trinickia terrae]
MKLLRRLLMVLPALAAIGYAQATKWTNLSSASDLVYAIDTDSIAKNPQGYIEYLAKTVWTTPSPLPGSTAPVAVSVTRYQIDCGNKQWRALDTHYQAADGSSAGIYSPAPADWAAISPGTVVDSMFQKVC